MTAQTVFINQINRANHKALRQHISVNYRFEGFNSNEIKDYINSRISAAGCNEPIFSDDSFEILYSMTNGQPRQLNYIARMCLTSAASKSIKTIIKEDAFDVQEEVSILSN